MKRPPSISLVLPAWNEAEALPRAIESADTALRSVAEVYEIIVVDDGSTDATASVAGAMAERFPSVRLVRHVTNKGYGAALRSGFEAATSDLVAFTDADSQFDLSELDRFALLAERHQVVCGYRIDRQDSAIRKLYSRVYNALARNLLGIGVRDIDCAFKLFHRDVIRNLQITTDGFLVNSELLMQARQLGYSVVEVGVTHHPRTEGESTVSPTHIPVVLRDLFRLWWSRSCFPGKSEQPRHERGSDVVALVLLAVAALVLFTGLGHPLIGRDETRYAEIPREMVATGDWVTPRLNFRPYYDKPPLMYWMVAASYRVLGTTEAAARLPHALSCYGALVLTVFFARRWFGSTPAMLAGLVYLLSVGFLATSRVLLIDGLLTLLVTLSLGAAFEAVRGPSLRWRWWIVAACACGLGTLAKGPIALVLLAPPVAVYSFLTPSAARLGGRAWAALAAIVVGIAAPWFVAVARVQPDFLYEFFYRHNVARFGGAFHAQPIWYFLPVLLIAGHPWSFLSVTFVKSLWSGAEADRQGRVPEQGFLLLWVGWCVLFFSASGCKLPSYVMPAFPALAVLMGTFLHRRLNGSLSVPRDFFERVAPWNAALTTAVVGVGFAVFCGVTGVEGTPFALACGAAWIALGLVTLVLRFRPWTPVASWGVSLAMCAVLAVLVTHREMPRYAAGRTLFGPGSPLVETQLVSAGRPIVTLGAEWAEVPFYLGRDDIENLPLPDGDFRSVLRSQGQVLLVTQKRRPLSLEGPGLEGVVAREVAQRGPGVVYEVTTPSHLAQGKRPASR